MSISSNTARPLLRVPQLLALLRTFDDALADLDADPRPDQDVADDSGHERCLAA